MKLRTYFWPGHVVSRPGLIARKLLGRRRPEHFVTGNAGDLLTRELLSRRYGYSLSNDPEGGRRLLVVGSLAHRVAGGDLLCGIGTKGLEVPKPCREPIPIRGLRGPLSLQAFKAAGHDVSGVRFLLDPGLLVRFMVDPKLLDTPPRGAIFVAHYRERSHYFSKHALPKEIRLVDVDTHPLQLAEEIVGAELVYSSSLHGIIFAHALARPCIFVMPRTAEPTVKYRDYFASIGLANPKPLSDIWQSRVLAKPNSPLDLRYSASSFSFPTAAEIEALGLTAP